MLTTIEAPYELGKRTGTQSLCMFPAMQPRPNLPLFNEADMPPELIREHYQTETPPDVRIHAISGLRLGGHCSLMRGGELFQHPEVHPSYMNNINDLPDDFRSHILGSLINPEAEIISLDEPIASVTHHHYVYGHFILENITRIYLLHLLDKLGIKFKVAMPNQVPGYIRGALTKFFGDRIVAYNALTQVIESPHVILPSMMQTDYNFHPFANLAMDFWRDSMLGDIRQATEPTYRRVYLSRGMMPARSWRHLVNEPEVDATLRDLGFTVIYPELLPYEEQMRVYSTMECCVSEFGSASHNSLFAAPGTRSLVINALSGIQSRISQLRSQHLAVQFPSDGHRRREQTGDTSYRVDCTALKKTCIEFFQI